MATAITMEGAETAREGKGRRTAATARKRGAREDGDKTTRFFLGKVDGDTAVLEREVGSENEALLESLKTGQSYFAVSEWRAVADLSKETPQIRRETVKREERDYGLALPRPQGPRSGAPAQAS